MPADQIVRYFRKLEFPDDANPAGQWIRPDRAGPRQVELVPARLFQEPGDSIGIHELFILFTHCLNYFLPRLRHRTVRSDPLYVPSPKCCGL